MLESQIDQAERRRVLDNDRKVRESGTMHAHALADAQIPRGRFSAIDNAEVVGAKPFTNYPAAAAHQADPVPDEPPLGFAIDELEPTVSPPPVEAQAPDPTSLPPLGDVGSLSQSGDPADVPASTAFVDDVERCGSPPSSGDLTTEVIPHFPASRPVGSPVPYRRR